VVPDYPEDWDDSIYDLNDSAYSDGDNSVYMDRDGASGASYTASYGPP